MPNRPIETKQQRSESQARDQDSADALAATPVRDDVVHCHHERNRNAALDLTYSRTCFGNQRMRVTRRADDVKPVVDVREVFCPNENLRAPVPVKIVKARLIHHTDDRQ